MAAAIQLGQADEKGRTPRTGLGPGRPESAPDGVGRGKDEQGQDEPQRPGIEVLQLCPEEPGEGPAAAVAHPSYEGEDDEQEGQEGGPSRAKRSRTNPAGPLRAKARGTSRPAMRKNSPIANMEPRAT